MEPATELSLVAPTTGDVANQSEPDRFATAAEIAPTGFATSLARVRMVGEAAGGWQGTAVENLSDQGAPVLFAEGTRVPPSSAVALRQVRPRRLDVLADHAEVSDDVLEQQLVDTDGTGPRLAAP